MLSKLKSLYCPPLRQASFCLKNICREDLAANDLNGVSFVLLNAFCTVSEPLKTDVTTTPESPELPHWVKSCGEELRSKKLKDDDFVPPSVSYWIENHKNRVKEVNMKSVVNNIVETDIDKVSVILKNLFKSPDSVVKALYGCDVDVSNGLVEQVLRRFSWDWIPAFGFFNWAETHKGTTHSAHLYNLMVDNLGKTRKFDIMWDFLGEMKNMEGYVTLETMTKIVRRLAKSRKYEDAIEAFKKMELFGVEKDITAMNMLMDALVKQGSVEHAERVYSDFKDQIPPNSRTYNVLVHGWCRIRQMDKAINTIDEMKKHGFSPDSVTYTSLIESYSRERDFRRVEATLEEMKKNGLHPSVVTYSVIMTGLSKAKETDKALEVYEEMKQNNCSPDAAFYSVFINALSQAGRLKDSDAVFEDMSKQGVCPDVATYNTLIQIAAKNLQEEKALNLLRKMEENECRPDLTTYAPLLKMCCILNRMKVLSFLLSHMFRNDVSVDLGTYSLMVNRLCKNGRLDRACSLFEEMVLKGFVPMDCTLNILIQGLQRKGMLEEMQRVENLMLGLKNPMTRD